MCFPRAAHRPFQLALRVPQACSQAVWTEKAKRRHARGAYHCPGRLDRHDSVNSEANRGLAEEKDQGRGSSRRPRMLARQFFACVEGVRSGCKYHGGRTAINDEWMIVQRRGLAARPRAVLRPSCRTNRYRAHLPRGGQRLVHEAWCRACCRRQEGKCPRTQAAQQAAQVVSRRGRINERALPQSC